MTSTNAFGTAGQRGRKAGCSGAGTFRIRSGAGGGVKTVKIGQP